MGYWWGKVWCLGLQWGPSPIFQQHVVTHLQNYQGRKKYTTDQPYSTFPLLLKHPDILNHRPIIFYDTILTISFQVSILNIYSSNHSDSVLFLQFFYKSWKYFCFLLAQDLPNINTKLNLWLLTKYTNKVTYNQHTLHK